MPEGRVIKRGLLRKKKGLRGWCERGVELRFGRLLYVADRTQAGGFGSPDGIEPGRRVKAIALDATCTVEPATQSQNAGKIVIRQGGDGVGFGSPGGGAVPRGAVLAELRCRISAADRRPLEVQVEEWVRLLRHAARHPPSPPCVLLRRLAARAPTSNGEAAFGRLAAALRGAASRPQLQKVLREAMSSRCGGVAASAAAGCSSGDGGNDGDSGDEDGGDARFGGDGGGSDGSSRSSGGCARSVMVVRMSWVREQIDAADRALGRPRDKSFGAVKFDQVFKDMNRDVVEIGIVEEEEDEEEQEKNKDAAGVPERAAAEQALCCNPLARSGFKGGGQISAREGAWECTRVDRDADAAFGVLTSLLRELDATRRRGGHGGHATSFKTTTRPPSHSNCWPGLAEEQTLAFASKILASAGTRTQSAGNTHDAVNFLFAGRGTGPEVQEVHVLPADIVETIPIRIRISSFSLVSGIRVEVACTSFFQLCDDSRECLALVRANYTQSFLLEDASVSSVTGPGVVAIEILSHKLGKIM